MYVTGFVVTLPEGPIEPDQFPKSPVRLQSVAPEDHHERVVGAPVDGTDVGEADIQALIARACPAPTNMLIVRTTSSNGTNLGRENFIRFLFV